MQLYPGLEDRRKADRKNDGVVAATGVIMNDNTLMMVANMTVLEAVTRVNVAVALTDRIMIFNI